MLEHGPASSNTGLTHCYLPSRFFQHVFVASQNGKRLFLASDSHAELLCHGISEGNYPAIVNSFKPVQAFIATGSSSSSVFRWLAYRALASCRDIISSAKKCANGSEGYVMLLPRRVSSLPVGRE